MKQSRPPSTPANRHHDPRGLVLIVVLVVIVLLSLGAYTFSEFMIIENKSAVFHAKTIQARAMADSGVEFVSTILGNRATAASIGLFHNPAMFQGHLMIDSAQAGGRGRFTVIAPVEGDITAKNVRFGLIDESSKLNLNTILDLVAASEAAAKAAAAAATAQNQGQGQAQGQNSGTSTTTGTSSSTGPPISNPLMGLPGMTVEIADAIFDWIDEDDEQREYGAENEIYQALNPPYECKNMPFETLDELLLVRGVTPQLVFGEDANRNGLLDPNENDGALSPPLDNGDSILDRGWATYLTVYSRELNLQTDRTLRIDVNKNTLDALYDSLESALDTKAATFIVAYRLFGPAATTTPGTPAPGGPAPGGPTPGGPRPGGSTPGGSTPGGSTPAGGLNPLNALLGGTTGSVTRGNMELSGGGKFQLKSPYDLVGVTVTGKYKDGSPLSLPSPWEDQPSAMAGYMPKLLDLLSLHGTEQYIEGRVNINQAHREVLIGLPNMTEDLVQKIVGAQLRGPSGEPLSESDSKRSNIAWLYTDSIVDLPTLKLLDPYITGKGDVFRMQVLGHFDSGGPVVRIEAILDATQNPPQPIFFRDLTDLGRGYTVPQVAPTK